MIRQYYDEWPDEASLSMYPFVDTASLTDNTREMVLSKEHFEDAKLWPNNASSRVFMRSIERDAAGLVFSIADNDKVLMTARVTVQELASARKVLFIATVANRVAGWIRFAPGALISIYDNPTDVYRFGPRATEFVSSVVSSVRYAGVTGFVVDGQVVSGDVTMFGGRGVKLSIVEGAIEVSAIGDPFARRDTCSQNADNVLKRFYGALLTPIRKINVSYTCGPPDELDDNYENIGAWEPEGGEITISAVDNDDVVGGRPNHLIRAPGAGSNLMEWFIG